MSHTNLLFRWLLRGSRDVPQNRRRVRDRAGNRRRLTGLESLEPALADARRGRLAGWWSAGRGNRRRDARFRAAGRQSAILRRTTRTVSPRDYLQQVSLTTSVTRCEGTALASLAILDQMQNDLDARLPIPGHSTRWVSILTVSKSGQLLGHGWQRYCPGSRTRTATGTASPICGPVGTSHRAMWLSWTALT